jgi:predicted DNA-binding ribbon-helix-helix protein
MPHVAAALSGGGNAMKSSVTKRSVILTGHKTSVSLEDEFWKGLREIAHMRGMSASELITDINADRQNANLSSAIRLFVLAFYRDQIDSHVSREGNALETLGTANTPGRRLAI